VLESKIYNRGRVTKILTTQNNRHIYGLFRPRKRLFVGALLSISLLFAFISWLVVPSAYAAQTAPYKVNFQGRLTDASGNAKAAGSYNIKFRLMSASSGGSNLWQADRVRGASDFRITITTGGLFTIQLGDTALGDPALSPSIFNTATNATVYLEVELPTPATATCSTNGCASFTEGAMTPRSLLASAAYAFNSDTVDGIDGASLAQLSSNQTFTGNNTFTGTFLHKNASNTTTAFQIQKADGTPLLVADTSGLALKVGGGDVSPDASPALLVLDYKNTSGDPTGTDGAMYYNSSSKRFRCYQDALWKDCVTAAGRRQFEFATDFMTNNYTTTSEPDLIFDGSSSTALDAGTTAPGHPGVVDLSTYLTSTSFAYLLSNAGTELFLGNGATWMANIGLNLPTLSTSSFRYTVRVGFIDAVNAETTDGCFFRYSDNINSGKWQGVCRDNNTESVCDTGVTVVAADWDDIKVGVNSAGTLATFVVDDTSSCTINSNIPTAAGRSTGYGAYIQKNVGSAIRIISLDYMEIRGNNLQR
jgi:hypothetical protein